jgi:hypothetical protein
LRFEYKKRRRETYKIRENERERELNTRREEERYKITNTVLKTKTNLLNFMSLCMHHCECIYSVASNS